MFSLSWEIKELNALSKSGHLELVEIKSLIDVLSKDDADIQSTNLPRRLSSLKTKMTDFVKRLSRFRRTPATHIFVVMVSSELRRKKPYALPVQCLPYAGMTEKDIRRLISDLICEMVKLGMSVRGAFTIIIALHAHVTLLQGNLMVLLLQSITILLYLLMSYKKNMFG